LNLRSKLLMLTAVMAFGAAPAVALGAGPNGHPTGTPGPHGATHRPSTPGPHAGQHAKAHRPSSPGPHAGQHAKAKAYGRYCQAESKKHVAGTPGTPFSDCVTDMAKLANGSADNPRTACKDESKKHVAGTPGTPFSLCVSSGAKLVKSEHDAD
jgi:hypothetical protein